MYIPSSSGKVPHIAQGTHDGIALRLFFQTFINPSSKLFAHLRGSHCCPINFKVIESN